MCKCPTCNSGSRKRLPRNLFFKLIPKAKAYKCYRCKTKYLYIPYVGFSFVIQKRIEKIESIVIQESDLITN